MSQFARHLGYSVTLFLWACFPLACNRELAGGEQAAPPSLSAGEIAGRRTALAARIPASSCTTLDAQRWRFDLDRNSGAWAITDKATGVHWTSDPAKPGFGEILLRDGSRGATWRIDRFDAVIVSPRQLRLASRPLVDGKPSGVRVVFTIEPVRGPDGLRLAYAARSAGPWRVARVRLLDAAFTVTEADEGRVYVPERLGIERSARDAVPGSEHWRTYDNLSMAMCGLVKQGSALLVNWDCVDTRLSLHKAWPNLPLVPGRRSCSISLEIESPQGACTIHPLGRGNYVEIAQAYRPLAKAKGWLHKWTEKHKSYPTVDWMFGATDFKPFVLSRVMPGSRFYAQKKEHVRLGYTFDEVAQCAEHWRNDMGIERAMVVLAGWINRGYDVAHPDVLPAAPECGGNDGLADAARRIKACGYLFGLHDNYQDMYEDAPSWNQQWLNKNAQGAAKMGGNWNGGQAWQVCAIKQVELAARKDTNLPKIAALFGPTIYFIDTVFAWGLVTCEDPAHPMTRLDDLHWKSRLCLLAKAHFSLFGSEEGREWAVPCADYLEGLFSHQTASPPGSVIPLFPLVYNDCVQILTHQGDRIGPGDDKKVADHVLFAQMPLPRFGAHLYWRHVAAPGRPRTMGLWSRGDGGWPERLCAEDRVIKNTWEVLSPLNRLVAQRPLASHEFLTPDRLVARTRFGDATITVAYGQPARVGDNILPACGFIVESPSYVAFCATRYNGLDYAQPALFTVRSLDGRPIGESSKVRIYHGFGDARIRLAGKEFQVRRESVVPVKPITAVDRSYMDPNVSPCKDFYGYANGAFEKVPIPGEYAAYGVNQKIDERNFAILQGILESSARTGGPKGSVVQRVGDFYAAGMDEALIDRAGLRPLTPWLNRIHAIESAKDLVAVIAALQAQGLNVGFRIDAEIDDKDATRMIASLSQGGLGLPERDYYFREGKAAVEIRAAYLAYIARTLALAGDAAPAARSAAASIMALETKLARTSRTLVALRDPEKNYNQYPRAALTRLAPAVDWNSYFTTIAFPPGESKVLVRQPEFFTGLSRLLASEPLAAWRDYLRWHMLSETANYLSEPFVEAHFAFYGRKLSGATELRPRWKRVLTAADAAIGEDLGQLYVQKAFSLAAKARAQTMVNFHKEAMRARVRAADWMSPATKAQAYTKLDTMRSKVGYPDKWRDYGKLEIARRPYVLNVLAANHFEFRRALAKLGKPVDRQEWHMSPQTNNAYYEPTLNEMCFPAGILQPPFFDEKADDAANYGAIGATIGHEMTHGFDDEGRQYDAAGNLKNWWSEGDAQRFQARAERVARQYDAFEVLPGLRINGHQTLGENIADIGGLRVAYGAFKLATSEKNLTPIDGFTPDQRFFIAFAQSWRTNERPEAVRLHVGSDVHSPVRWRVLGPVANFPEFNRAFGCPTSAESWPAIW
jgi:putative endopeptidase